MRKYIRGLYIASCYAIALPIVFVILLIGFVYFVVKGLITGNRWDLDDIKETISACVYGVKQGHKINMWYVKHGNNPMDFDELARDL